MKTSENTITVETWLPCFPGFYESIITPDYDLELNYIDDLRGDKGLIGNIDDLYSFPEFKETEYRETVAKAWTTEVERLLKEVLPSIEITYQVIVSPREYNFYTDSVNVEVTLDKEELHKVIIKNKGEFAQYLRDNYTSYDGFISRYSNDVSDWLSDWDNTVIHEHELGALLQFVLRHISPNLHKESLFDDIKEYVVDFPCIELTDEWYEKLTTMHIVNGVFVGSYGNAPSKQLHVLERDGHSR